MSNVAATPSRKRLITFSWALWDWAEQPYPTIIQTFIFATYITSKAFGNPDANTNLLSIGTVIATVIVALTAPVIGRRSDAGGKRKFWLLVNSGALVAIMAASYFVEPSPQFLIFGIALYSLGSVVQETSFINYFAMLRQVTTKSNIGKVSGLAWGFGYVGGIILLLLSLVGFVLPDQPWFGVSTDGAQNIRILFLFSAIWMAVFTIPLALFVPETEAQNTGVKESVLQSYRAIAGQLKDLRRRSPEVLKFLIASAIYRDGLAGVFTYGAILGSVAFGFSTTQVIFYGIGANIVAGIGAALGGWLDDRIGSKRTITIALTGLMVSGLAVFAFAGFGKITYWVFGLILCLFVGPAQASSRTFVARFTPDGREGEIFGLYQTTGELTMFLSPLFWLLATGLAAGFGITHTAIFGILGLVVVLGVGLLLLVRVHPNPDVAE